MSNDHNMTPFQLSMPKEIQREAYERLPMTCDSLRAILTVAQDQLMKDLGVEPHDVAIVDAAMSFAFQRIRDQITQPFRDQQMRLLKEIQNLSSRIEQ